MDKVKNIIIQNSIKDSSSVRDIIQDMLNRGVRIRQYVYPNVTHRELYLNRNREDSILRVKVNDKKDLSFYNIDERTYSTDQLSQIKMALDCGIVLTDYVDNKYNFLQMEEIRIGLESNIDITSYNNVDISADEMSKIRLGLSK